MTRAAFGKEQPLRYKKNTAFLVCSVIHEMYCVKRKIGLFISVLLSWLEIWRSSYGLCRPVKTAAVFTGLQRP